MFFVFFSLEPSVQPTQDLGSDNADNSSDVTTDSFTTSTQVTVDNPSEYCPDGAVCSDLSQECLVCGFNTSCLYGKPDTISCTVKEPVQCVVSLSSSFVLILFICALYTGVPSIQYCFRTVCYRS